MEIISRGEVTFTQLPLNDGGSIAVRAPGLHVAWRTREPLPPFAATAAAADVDDWSIAIAENGLAEFVSLEAQPVAVDGAAVPALTMPDSRDAYVELRPPAPSPGEGLLLMVETAGVVQWYLPVNAPSVRRPSVVRNDVEGIGAEAEPALAPAAPAQFRFLVPQSTLSRGASLPVPRGTAPAGLFDSVRGAVVRFFRFTFIRELVGQGIARVVEWIAEHIESRNKQEGFRWFDRANGYPYVTEAELQGLAGQNVLLLTHGIFSSVEGAFHGISNPDSTVLQHLRARYGRNIIGWDHWTIAKTPLENAREMLSSLPAGVRPDIICHSRGGLVTRAMLEHPSLQMLRASRFDGVGKAIFVAGANQGSQLASTAHINRLLNIYSAIGSIPILGSAGVVLKVVVGLLKVLAHGVSKIPSIQALLPDPAQNAFLRALNGELMTPTDEIVVLHANYDPSSGPLAGLLDLNVDIVFNQANDMVVPYPGAEVFDKWQQVGTNFRFGSATQTQPVVMHTNFFFQESVHQLLQSEL